MIVETQVKNNHYQKNGPGVILDAKDIWHSYDGYVHVLRGVNVKLKQGLFTVVLGRSASGKTTLVKILANVLKPAKGQINLYSSHRVAYIPQHLGLVRSKTALDNVLIGALGYTKTFQSLFKRFDDEVYIRAKEILSDLGMEDKADKKIWDLSGGERQRVAIGRALIQDPQLILADEFVSQLDPLTSMEILDTMKKLTQNKISILITTHDIAIAKKYADKVIIMKSGEIASELASGECSPEEILERIK